MARTATLAGSRYNPRLILKFGYTERLPFGIKLPKYPEVKRFGKKPPTKPTTLTDWVKMLPGRYFDRELGAWVVTDPGPDAQRVLTDLGFDIDLSYGHRAGVTTLNDLTDPWYEVDTDNPWVTHVYTRFSGLATQLPAGSQLNPDTGVYDVHTPDLRHVPARFNVPAETLRIAQQLVDNLPQPDLGTDPSTRWPKILAALPRAPKRLPEGMPSYPSWTPITLYGYQEAGCYALLGGHTLLADAPGLGKTFSSIAAHALKGTKRLLVVSPPVALTNWVSELEAFRYAYEMKPRGKGFARNIVEAREEAGTIVLITSTRKVRTFPEGNGVVVVSDSLTSNRRELQDMIRAWNPDGFIVDESHRLKTWESARARSIRSVAQQVNGLRIAISGTPMLSTPVELASQLAITGHLDTVFGGLDAFLNAYAYLDNFGKWVPRKRALPQLREILFDQVWVRRMPEEVYNRADSGGPSMPPVLPPRARLVDVDLKLYREALEAQEAKVDQWLDMIARSRPDKPEPTDEELSEFSRTAIGFISPLRKAAGLCKIEAATEYIAQWIESDPNNENPLLVWTHHTEVTEAMAQAVRDLNRPVAIIDGTTSVSARGRIKDEFQAGKYSALVLSLQAAGVALTLTRGCDNLFVESDWTPATLTQARDRTRRIGQKRSVTLTTLIATGTLDEHLQRVQRRKAADLDVVAGEGHDTSVMDAETDDLATPGEIVQAIIERRMEARRRSRNRKKAA